MRDPKKCTSQATACAKCLLVAFGKVFMCCGKYQTFFYLKICCFLIFPSFYATTWRSLGFAPCPWLTLSQLTPTHLTPSRLSPCLWVPNPPCHSMKTPFPGHAEEATWLLAVTQETPGHSTAPDSVTSPLKPPLTGLPGNIYY